MPLIQCVPFHELGPPIWEEWSRLLSLSPLYQNPFLTPEFAHAVAAVRPSVEVALIERQGELTGVLPFQRSRSQAFPVGGELSNCQAFLQDPRALISPRAVLERCGLRSWNFHQLVDPHETLTPHAWEALPGRFIHLADGFEPYRQQRGTRTKKFEKIENRRRKLEREIGPLTFELQTTDQRVLDHLMAWKSAQYRRHLLVDVFGFDWVPGLLRRLLTRPAGPLTVYLSGLCAGNRLVAAAFDLRYGSVVDAWFTAYDRRYAVYSPGSILLHEKLRAYPERGVTRYVLGAGSEAYKQSFTTDCFPMFRGAVSRGGLRDRWQKHGHHAKQWMRSLPFSSWAKWPARCLRLMRDSQKFR